MERQQRIHLHWFWRAALATLVGWVYVGLVMSQIIPQPDRLSKAADRLVRHWPGGSHVWMPALIIPALYFLPAFLIVLTVYGLLTWYCGPLTDSETRCRKCGYILRGISEPRCPECGERI